MQAVGGPTTFGNVTAKLLLLAAESTTNYHAGILARL
jgi:hypothetical protein